MALLLMVIDVIFLQQTVLLLLGFGCVTHLYALFNVEQVVQDCDLPLPAGSATMLITVIKPGSKKTSSFTIADSPFTTIILFSNSLPG